MDMSNDVVLTSARAQELIEQLDEMCKESEVIRARVEDAMREDRRVRPERRRIPRGLTAADRRERPTPESAG
jgi:hypothetical protein